MSRNRTTKPETTRLFISDGDWIEVKTTLNNGDNKRLEAAGLKPPVMIDGRIIAPIDWAVHDIERALIFLTDWSFRGFDDHDLPLNRDSVMAIDPETFEEVNKAILEHVIKQAKEKKERAEARKKEETPDPTPTPGQTTLNADVTE